MVNKREPIPKNMTIEEASEFWDTHSVADYPSHVVQLEYTLKKPAAIDWDYDEEADVLYLSVGEPQPAVGIDVGEG